MSNPESGLSRRKFLTATTLSAGGLLVSPYLTGCAPANSGTARTSGPKNLSIMAWSHSVPATDVAFDEFAQEWGAANNVNVRVDHTAINDIPARLGSEIRAQSGHDIVQMPPGTGVSNFADQLADITSEVEELGKAYGGWSPLAEQGAKYNGAWLAYPDYGIAVPGFYRKDLFDQFTLEAPTTWDAVLEAGRALKPEGHPLGLTLSHTGDANQYWMALLWGYGGAWANAEGRFAGLDSPGLREGLQMAKAIYNEGCTPDVLSWDDSGNNTAYISGVSSYTINGLSILGASREANPDVAAQTLLEVPPSGPAGGAMLTNLFGLGIWKFSKVRDLATAFLSDYHDRWQDFAEVSEGFNLKLFNEIPRPYPVLDEDPLTEALVDSIPLLASVGHPGPATPAASEVATNFVIIDLVIEVVQGGSVDSAIETAEAKIRSIYTAADLL